MWLAASARYQGWYNMKRLLKYIAVGLPPRRFDDDCFQNLLRL
jgi:hypothetical protein